MLKAIYRVTKHTRREVGPIFCPKSKCRLLLIATTITKTRNNLVTTTTILGIAMEIATPLTHNDLAGHLKNPLFSSTRRAPKIIKTFNKVAAEVRTWIFRVRRNKKLEWFESHSFQCSSGSLERKDKSRFQTKDKNVVFSSKTLRTSFSHADLYLDGKLLPHKMTEFQTINSSPT